MSKPTILIADDDARVLAALETRLEAEGYSVTTTSDAYQAVAIARRDRPDLLLLDINMPAGNGFSVQERAAKIPEIDGTPVIYITGEEPENVDLLARELGAFAIIHKPFKTEELMEAIRSALGFYVYSPVTD